MTAAEGDEGTMPPEEVVAMVEALLFAQGGRLSLRALEEATGQTRETLRAALRDLAVRREGSGIQLRPVGSEWQLHTAERFAPWIVRLRGNRPKPLSRAAMEVLSVVAYRQPVSVRWTLSRVSSARAEGIGRPRLGACRRPRREPGARSSTEPPRTFWPFSGSKTSVNFPTSVIKRPTRCGYAARKG